MMWAALCASRWEFFAGVEIFGWPGVGRTEGEELPRGRPNDYSDLGEYDSVDGGKTRRALYVVLEFVAAALGGATEFASPDLGLGASRRDPRVAPSTKHTGSNGGVEVLVKVIVFLSWSWSMALFSLVLLALAKNLFIRGPIALARLLVRRVVLSHLDVAAWAAPFFFLGCALDNCAPSGARYGLAGFEEIVGKGGLDPPLVVFSWLVVFDGKVGHRVFFISSFLKADPFGFPGACDLGRSYQGSS